MKQIIYDGKDKYFFEEIKTKKCGDNEIEVSTKIMGLCGSDVHKFLKQTPKDGYLSTKILGHEIMGTITNKGKNCQKYNIGDRVVINPFSIPNNMEKVESFSLADSEIGIVGRNIDGGYSELLYVPQNCVCVLPKNINDDDAIFIDDIAVGLHGLNYSKKLKEKAEKIAIIGDGPLGILCFKIFQSFYSKSEVILFSRNMNKLKNIECNVEKFENLNNYKNQFDIVIEAVGGAQSDTLNGAIHIGKNNSLILCYGVYQFNYLASLDVRTAFYKQITIMGINSYCNIHNDFENAILLLNTKKIKVNELITHRILFSNSIEFLNNYDTYNDKIKVIFEVK